MNSACVRIKEYWCIWTTLNIDTTSSVSWLAFSCQLQSKIHSCPAFSGTFSPAPRSCRSRSSPPISCFCSALCDPFVVFPSDAFASLCGASPLASNQLPFSNVPALGCWFSCRIVIGGTFLVLQSRQRILLLVQYGWFSSTFFRLTPSVASVWCCEQICLRCWTIQSVSEKQFNS